LGRNLAYKSAIVNEKRREVAIIAEHEIDRGFMILNNKGFCTV
jgi:hypothetical protein